MKTRIIVGANAAYFCITTDRHSMDIKLDHGKSPAASLEAYINEEQQRINRRAEHLEIIRAALAHHQQEPTA